MKVRNLRDLEDALDRGMSWRKKELTALKFAIDGATDPTRPMLLRAGTALLYAHWEGFIKESGTAYVRFVAGQRPELSRMTANFVAVALGDRISECGRAQANGIRAALVEQLRALGPERAKIKWKGVIRTRSNLKATVLKEVVTTLGLDFAPYKRKTKTVIDRLVRARNVIAHGKGMQVGLAEYDLLHTQTIELLDGFKSQVLDAATNAAYLSAPPAAPPAAPAASPS
jgi:hypothetical protein